MSHFEPQGPDKLFVDAQTEIPTHGVDGDKIMPSHLGTVLFLRRLNAVLEPKTVLYIGPGVEQWSESWHMTGGGGGDFSARRSLDGALGDARFDLVIHNDPASAAEMDAVGGMDLVEGLALLGDRVCFVTLDPVRSIGRDVFGFWRHRFTDKNWFMFDLIRPLVQGEASVAPEIRYGGFLFVRAEAVPFLPGPVFATAIRRDEAIDQNAPLFWRLKRWGRGFWAQRLFGRVSQE